MSTSDLNSLPQLSSPAAHTSTESTELVIPQQSLGSDSAERELCFPETQIRVKSEPRSHSPPPTMASTARVRNPSVHRSSGPAGTISKPMSSLISGMIDNTQYASVIQHPWVPRKTTASDEKVARRVAADIAAFPVSAANNENRQPLKRSDRPPLSDPASVIVPANEANDRQNLHNNLVTTNPVEAAGGFSNAQPKAADVMHHDFHPILSSPSTSRTLSYQRSANVSHTPKLDRPKPIVPRSLFPSPSATMSSSDLPNSSVPSKRPRTGRSEHPERFLYSGNTFSNLGERAFHEATETNPYLSPLTADAARPVYKTPMEARNALKEADKPPVAPVDYDQQIKDLTILIADFRKRYEKSKVMTAQAGIQVEGNVWDRLSNIVQYPPDFDSYSQQGQGELGKYGEEMKAWDRAIGHQVIIKKRIVYREAIEKLQVKLEILQAEKDLDTHSTNLKRKAETVADREGADDG